MCAGIANIIIKYGPIIKKKKKKATRPTLFENFMLLQCNNFFFLALLISTEFLLDAGLQCTIQPHFRLIFSILYINNIYKMPYKMQSMIMLNDFVFHSRLDKI